MPRSPVLDLKKSINFSASTDKVDLGADFIGVGDVTVVTCINPRSYGSGSTARILDNGKFLLTLVSTGRLQLASDGSTFAASATGGYPFNKWTPISVIRTSAGLANFRVNKASNGTANQSSGTPAAGTTNVFLGNRSAADRPFDGKIGYQIIFNRILTAKEQDNCHDGIMPTDYETSCIKHLTFENDTATTVYESAGRGYASAGTITGATFSQDTPSKGRAYAGQNLFTSKIGGVGSVGYPGVSPVGTLLTTSSYIEDERFGWNFTRIATSASAKYDSSVQRTGKPTLKVSLTDVTGRVRVSSDSVNGGAQEVISNLTKLIPVKPNTTYTINCYAKTNNVATNGVYVYIKQIKNDLSANADKITNKLSGTNDWTLLTLTFTTAKDTVWNRIELWSDVAGNISDVWFDVDSLTFIEAIVSRNLTTFRRNVSDPNYSGRYVTTVGVFGKSSTKLYGSHVTSGHYMTSVDGITWVDRTYSPSVYTPQCLQIIFDEVNNVMFASCANAKLFRATIDDFNHWTDITPPSLPSGTTGRVDIVAHNGTYLFYGNYGTPAGPSNIYRSSDNGSTWTEVLTQADARHVHVIYVDPTNPSRIFANFGDQNYAGMGLWYSASNGDIGSWIHLSSVLYGINMVLDQANQQILMESDGNNDNFILSYPYSLIGTPSDTNVLVTCISPKGISGASWKGTTRNLALLSTGDLIFITTSESLSIPGATRDGIWLSLHSDFSRTLLLEELTGNTFSYGKTYEFNGYVFIAKYRITLPVSAGRTLIT